jgi:hypothetical protein
MQGGDWAGAVYSSQGCPGTCVGKESTKFSILNTVLPFDSRLRQRKPVVLPERILRPCMDEHLSVMS